MAYEGADEPAIDIYGLLEACTAEELAPMVDALAMAPVAFLKLTRAYERHQPDHVRYTDQIGDETYRLGLLALGKSDGKRPTYQAMIAALCKQIGFAAGAGGPGGGETLLLNTFAKQHLSSTPVADRDRLVAEASKAVAAAASGVFSSDAWPPLASTLVQLAYLRRKLADDGRLRPTAGSKALTLPSQGTPSGADVAEVVSIQVRGDELIAMSTGDVARDGWRDLDASPKLAGSLAPILNGVQTLIAASQMLRGDELLRRLPDGAEGVAHIVEKGRKGMGALGSVPVASLLGPMALMTLAGAMAEQRKLEAIERSLGEIKAAVADVSRFQKEERRSVLKGSIRYFQQMAASVLAGELAPEVLQEIERHEVDLVRVQEHLTDELSAQIAELRAIRKETFGSSKYLKSIQEAQIALDTRYDELFLCLRARACGYQLLCAYPGREAGKKVRLADITDALGAFSPAGNATLAMDATLREKIAASSFDIKALVLGDESALLDRIDLACGRILEALNNARSDAVVTTEAISFDLRLKDGQPIGMRLA